MKYENKFKNLKLMNIENKKKYYGGSLWTGSLAFAMISSTIMNFVQLIFNIVNSFNRDSTSTNSTSTNSNYNNSTYSNLSSNNMTIRLSNTPLRTMVNYPV